MSLEQWRTNVQQEQPALNDEEDIDLLNDETFGDGVVVSGGDWESHRYSSDKEDHKNTVMTRTNNNNNDTKQLLMEPDNISHFERLGLKDLWESSPETSSGLDSIWSPSALPQPSPLEKINSGSPIHTSANTSKSNIVSVQDLEKSIIGSSNSPSQSPPHSPLSSNVLPISFRNVHSSPSPSPPPPSHPIMGLYPRHPAPHPMMFPHARPPPGFPMTRPHPHQHFMPPTMVPMPYFGRGPVPPHRFPPPFLPPNVPLMGPPRMIAGFPSRAPLLLHPSQMGPIPNPMHPDVHRNPRPHYRQYSSNPMSSKLSEMLYDVKPDGSGFMTGKEKEWVIKVQLIQLHSSNPETDDYYYQKFIQQKYQSNDKEGVANTSDKLTPLTLPPPVADHKEKTRSAFEGTLGKVSVGSVTAPRRTIDVTPPSSSDIKTDATSRKKQALITIEKMYTVLLLLDDLQSVVSDNDTDLEKKCNYCDQLFLLLGFSDEFSFTRDYSSFQQLMSFQKGKRLFKRLLPYLDENKSKVALLCFSKNLTPIIKKDTQDKILPELLPALSVIINTCDMTELQHIISLIQPLVVSKYTNNQFFISYVTLVVNRGYHISSSRQPANDWSSLLSEMNSVLLKSKTKSDILSKILTTPPTNN